MNLDRIAFNQHRHEGLDTQTVQCGSAIQQDRTVLNHVFQNVPDLRPVPLHHALGILDVGGYPQHGQPVHDEGLEQLQSHPLGQTALVHLQFGAYHNHRASAVIDALAQQVLAEAPLLASQEVGQRLELVVMTALDGPSAAPVVYQGVHRFLQHPLLVANDNLRRAKVHEPFQPVVPVDDAAVEIVQVAGGEPAAVELNHGAQFGR